MTLDKCRPIVFCLAAGGALVIGLFSLLNGSIQMARANPGELFAQPGGSGATCSQAP